MFNVPGEGLVEVVDYIPTVASILISILFFFESLSLEISTLVLRIVSRLESVGYVCLLNFALVQSLARSMCSLISLSTISISHADVEHVMEMRVSHSHSLVSRPGIAMESGSCWL
jgi:hypothetical protein